MFAYSWRYHHSVYLVPLAWCNMLPTLHDYEVISCICGTTENQLLPITATLGVLIGHKHLLVWSDRLAELLLVVEKSWRPASQSTIRVLTFCFRLHSSGALLSPPQGNIPLS